MQRKIFILFFLLCLFTACGSETSGGEAVGGGDEGEIISKWAQAIQEGNTAEADPITRNPNGMDWKYHLENLLKRGLLSDYKILPIPAETITTLNKGTLVVRWMRTYGGQEEEIKDYYCANIKIIDDKIDVVGGDIYQCQSDGKIHTSRATATPRPDCGYFLGKLVHYTQSYKTADEKDPEDHSITGIIQASCNEPRQKEVNGILWIKIYPSDIVAGIAWVKSDDVMPVCGQETIEDTPRIKVNIYEKPSLESNVMETLSRRASYYLSCDPRQGSFKKIFIAGKEDNPQHLEFVAGWIDESGAPTPQPLIATETPTTMPTDTATPSTEPVKTAEAGVAPTESTAEETCGEGMIMSEEGEILSVYKEPLPDAEIVGSVKKNDVVMLLCETKSVLGGKQTFAKARTKDGLIGWIDAGYIFVGM